jgi:hypothetical protein
MIFFMVVLILAGAVSRLVPHPPNVAAIAAIALVGGLYLDRRIAVLIPLGAMIISDVVIGFHGLTAYVYCGFLLTGMIGVMFRSVPRLAGLAAGSVCASVLFYIITNAGVWLTGDGSLYPRTFEGLIACYIAALPFFRNSIAGDLVYTGLLAVIFEIGIRYGLRTSLTQSTLPK